jgi:hypothetical protein
VRPGGWPKPGCRGSPDVAKRFKGLQAADAEAADAEAADAETGGTSARSRIRRRNQAVHVYAPWNMASLSGPAGLSVVASEAIEHGGCQKKLATSSSEYIQFRMSGAVDPLDLGREDVEHGVEDIAARPSSARLFDRVRVGRGRGPW